jgi:predicted PurR-regulated permease PerM
MNQLNTSRVFRFLVNAAAFVVVVAGMRAASPILVQFLLAVFIAVILTPVFIGLQRKGISSVVALLILIFVLVVAGTVGVSVIGNSLNEFSKNLPEYQGALQAQVTRLAAWLKSKDINVPSQTVSEMLNATTAVRIAGNTVTALSALLGKAFVILLIVIFILFEAAILPAKVRAMPGLSDEMWQSLCEVVDNVRQYMGMKTLMSLLTGFLVGAMLALFRIDYAVLLGVLAFMLNYIPNVGSIMAAIPGVLLALVARSPGLALIIGIGYIVINALVGNVLEPRVMGKGLGLSPMIIVVSLLFWGWVLGPVGMLLSVPLTMTVKIALQSIDETQGIAVLLGSAVPAADEPARADPPGSDAA